MAYEDDFYTMDNIIGYTILEIFMKNPQYILQKLAQSITRLPSLIKLTEDRLCSVILRRHMMKMRT